MATDITRQEYREMLERLVELSNERNDTDARETEAAATLAETEYLWRARLASERQHEIARQRATLAEHRAECARAEYDLHLNALIDLMTIAE
jgi:hypothetical protein